MLFFKDDLKYGNYKSLLQFASQFCDMLTLQIPNYNKFIVKENNHEGNLEYEIGHCEISNDPLYDVYYDNANRLIERLFGKHIIKTFFDTNYLSSAYSNEHKIFCIRLDSEVVENLLFAGSLFAWKFPFLPEDLSFFIGEKCWLQSVGHEEICFVYDSSSKTFGFFRSLGIKFNKQPDDEIPTLKFETIT